MVLYGNVPTPSAAGRNPKQPAVLSRPREAQAGIDHIGGIAQATPPLQFLQGGTEAEGWPVGTVGGDGLHHIGHLEHAVFRYGRWHHLDQRRRLPTRLG